MKGLERRCSVDRNSSATLDEVEGLTRELERLKNDLRQIRGDLAGLGNDAVRAGRMGFNDVAKAAANQAKAAAEAAERQVAMHPYIAIGTALGVGVLFGAWFARRS